MFYIYRGVFVAINFGLVLLLSIRTLKRYLSAHKLSDCSSDDERVRVRKRNTVIKVSVFVLLFVFLSLLLLLCKYPFEAKYMTFSSVEDALSYIFIDTDDISVSDYDDCVFVIDKEYQLYSLTKIQDKYSFVDYGCDDYFYKADGCLVDRCKAKYNSLTDKTFYTVVVDTDKKPQDKNVELYYIESFDYIRDYELRPHAGSNNKVWVYAILKDGEPENGLTVGVEGETAYLDLKQINGIYQ